MEMLHKPLSVLRIGHLPLISLRRLSQTSGADSVISLKSAYVRDRGPVLGLDQLLTDKGRASNGVCTCRVHKYGRGVAARQDAPYGFCYTERPLDVYFARRTFYIGRV